MLTVPGPVPRRRFRNLFDLKVTAIVTTVLVVIAGLLFWRKIIGERETLMVIVACIFLLRFAQGNLPQVRTRHLTLKPPAAHSAENPKQESEKKETDEKKEGDKAQAEEKKNE